MNIKVDLRYVVFLVIIAVVSTFTISYMAFSGEWTAMRHRSENSGLMKVAEAQDIIDNAFIRYADDNALADGAVSGMVAALNDRWSYYLSADELERYLLDSRNQRSGIGVTIADDSKLRGIAVGSVVKNSPAANAGILEGDIIIMAGDTSLAGMVLTEASNLIGELIDEGTVLLTLLNSDDAEYTVELIPAIIDIDPVSYDMLDGNIGYISIINFEAKASLQLKEAVSNLLSSGAAAFVFDVRYNRGGQLSELLAALDYLLPECVTFASKSREGQMEYRTSDAECMEYPMAVLVNAGSYSAAEFFAAALSEHDWAIVVGEKTTGKGYAQETILLSDGSALHISTREYFTPNGQSLAETGLTPDIEVSLTDKQQGDLYYGRLSYEDDDQLIAAVAELEARAAGLYS